MKKLKIAIIGAGPAGSFSAYLLATLGHEVHLFEKKPQLNRRVCGEYLCPMGVDIINKHGLRNIILKDFLNLNGMVLNDVKINRVIKAYFPKLFHSSVGVSVNRKIFDERILQLAMSKNIFYHPDHQLLKLKRTQNSGYLLEFEQNSEASQNLNFSCDFLVAADGRNSLIARLLKHSPKANCDRIALHTYMPRKIERGVRLGEMHIFNDGSYCGLNPISDDEVNFSIVCDASLLEKKTHILDYINKKIQESDRLQSMFDPITNLDTIKTSSPLTHKNNFIAGDNLAYVGDAAGFIDPLTGEGMANALLSADILYTAMCVHSELHHALKDYKHIKRKSQFQKYILNTCFQFIIKKPKLVSILSSFLAKNEKRANIFIGIIGNIFTPLEGALKLLK